MGATVLIAMAIGETPVRIERIPSGYTAPVVVEIPIGHGIEHPQFPTMQMGADGEARHSRILWVGWLFGLCQIVLFIAALALGMRKENGLGPVKLPLVIGGVIFACIFTMLIYTYRGYMLGDSTGLIFGVPVPTAWMLYGIWLFPVYFVLLYMRAFDSWYLTGADRQRFDGLLAEAKRESHSGPAGN